MQSNASVHGIFEITDRDWKTSWAYFSPSPRRLSRGYPDELPWQQWWVNWGFDTYPTDTLGQGFHQLLREAQWAARHLGYPRRSQRKVSIEAIEELQEFWTLQKEHGEDFETLMLWEDPERLGQINVRWRLRGPQGGSV